LKSLNFLLAIVFPFVYIRAIINCNQGGYTMAEKELMDPETVISTCRDRAAFLSEVFSHCDPDNLSQRGTYGLVAMLAGIEEDLTSALARLGEAC
jgi:hypothetical protein